LTQDADGRFANRSFLIAPDGAIAARYDKIHMFDVNVSATEIYRESQGYRPGARAVLADAGWARIGMTVCYDLRFPHLYRRLAQAGAQVITVPAAFNHITGAAHWEPCCAPARSRPDASFWPRRRPAFTPKARARAGAPMAIRWPSRPGARFWPMPAPTPA
jgi:predicted amidohydrolase